MILLKKCPVCLSNKIKFSFKNKDRITDVKGEFNLWHCSKCSAYFINPMLYKSELFDFYPRIYYSFSKYDKKNIVRRFKLWYLKNIITKNNIIIYYLTKIINPLLASLKVIKKRHIPFIKGGKLLDIGCGSGDFIDKMNYMGMKVEGVDPFAKKDSLNNVKIHCVELEKAPLKNQDFDVITLNHVLEHTQNPHIIFSKVKKLLKDKGIFLIGVPNSESILSRIFKEYWIHWDTPRHVIMHNKNTLNYLAKTHDFKIISTKFVSDTKVINNAIINKLKEKKKLSFLKNIIMSDFTAIILWPFYKTINAIFRSGDHLEVIMIKNIDGEL